MKGLDRNQEHNSHYKQASSVRADRQQLTFSAGAPAKCCLATGTADDNDNHTKSWRIRLSVTITPAYKGLFPSQAQLIMVSGKYGPCIAYALLLLCPIFKKRVVKMPKSTFRNWPTQEHYPETIVLRIS